MSPVRHIDAIVVGASAGAIDALSRILPNLPERFSLPIMIVVHVPPDRTSFLVDLFRTKCTLKVKEVEDKEPIESGTIYFAPPDYHVLVESDRRLSLSVEERVQYSRPSIDVLFESAADAYGDRLLGIVLTGANSDGAQGLQNVCEAGGVAIVQRPDLAYSSEMPTAALAACPGALKFDLDEIAEFLLKADSVREVSV